MRVSRRVLIVAIVAALSIALQRGASAQLPAAEPTLRVQATSVEELRTWDAYVTQEERAGSLRVRKSRQDPDLPSRLVERLDQFHEGIPIWGADIVRSSERGVPISIFGILAPNLSLGVEPSLTPEAAGRALAGAGGREAVLLRRPELVVLPMDSGNYRLTYTAVVAAAGIDRIFIDAQTGVELFRYSEIKTQSAVGSGRGVLNDTKKISVSQQGGAYVASDALRPPTLLTFDMRGNLSRYKTVELGAALFSSDLASDTDNTWTDPAVVDAHSHVGMAYDYFYKRFGRRGLDDRNKPIYVITNAVSQQGALSTSNADSGYVVGASWCSSCGPGGVGLMFFGNGIPPGFSLGGQNWTYTAGALDVAAHELTHAVTDSSSDLIYANESGALNEAFSDMMGKSVEFYFHPVGSGIGQADYVLGKDVIRSLSPGVPHGLRSMANPALHGDPDHYRNRYVGPDDGGGVHSNSGIANHAFYLAIEGGINRTSGQAVTGVGAANREQIEKVFYRAFTLLMPRNATFATARAATTQAARDLYGFGGTVERAVDSAWGAVGVPDPRTLSTFTGSVNSGAVVSYAFSMPVAGSYTVNLRGNDPGVDLDLVLTVSTAACSRFPFPASCERTRSESPTAVESVRWPVRVGESYIIWIGNLGPRASSFTVEHFIGQSSTTSVAPTALAPTVSAIVSFGGASGSPTFQKTGGGQR